MTCSRRRAEARCSGSEHACCAVPAHLDPLLQSSGCCFEIILLFSLHLSRWRSHYSLQRFVDRPVRYWCPSLCSSCCEHLVGSQLYSADFVWAMGFRWRNVVDSTSPTSISHFMFYRRIYSAHTSACIWSWAFTSIFQLWIRRLWFQELWIKIDPGFMLSWHVSNVPRDISAW